MADATLATPLVLGYADQISLRPGETVAFKIGTRKGPRRYRAAIHRLIRGDADAEGPRTRHIPSTLDGEHQGREQFIDIGSYGVVDRAEAFDGLQRYTFQAFVQPTLPGKGRQVIAATWSADERQGFCLLLDENGALALELGDGTAQARLTTGRPLRRERWYHIGASVDLAAGKVALIQTPLAGHDFDPDREATASGSAPVKPAAGDQLFFAACRRSIEDGRRRTQWHFNGRIESPSLARVALSIDALRDAARHQTTAVPVNDVIARWDFAHDIPNDRLTDASPNQLHGRAVNAPKRAVCGHNWDGTAMNWQLAPHQYAAVHFHQDDLYDCEWATSHSWTLPDDLKSGIYSLKLEAEGGPPWWVTFFVRPKAGTRTADAVFLASTTTYWVYSNYRMRFVPGTNDLFIGALPDCDVTDLLLLEMPELGRSTYDRNSDGSGVCHVSRLRPLINLRPTGRFWNFHLDLCLIDWLEARGIACDIVTDDDLHYEGLKAIEGYRVVLTGCHPEYDSVQMLDALEAYLRRGGRLMYTGGNGFYWRVSYPDLHPGMVEVRRAEGGIRAWAERPGEYYHASTGEYGGLWRRHNRAPNALCGIGFISQGFDASSYYRRTDAAKDPRASFIFKGVEDEKLGEFGIVYNGAAGLELDSADEALGTPPHALVVASSENHSNAFQLVPEELTITYAGIDAVFNPRIRADMTFFETPNGGAVWSTGSIAYVGSLGHNTYDNNISRLTENVLRRFLDPTPFEMPK
jgi:N,N-dimethylformamidase